ncbi:hypothetical protein KKB55_17710 [Myxococcota bacterium]|nr:hypothetical protein [Myxococcota bacterium]MBU1899581.1 hypothetical protein [Myxococcota bacterium]
MIRHALPCLLLYGAVGCEIFIDVNNGGVECEDHAGCPEGESCFGGRCATSGVMPKGDDGLLIKDMFRPSPFDWGEPPDAADAAPRPDDGVDLDAALDATLDATPSDVGPTFDFNVAPDAASGDFGEGGEGCFEGASGVLQEVQGRGAHIPWAFCTPQLLLWTEQLPGAELILPRYQTGPDQQPSPLSDSPASILGGLVVEGGRALWEARHPARQGRAQIYTLTATRDDWLTGIPSATQGDQRQPALATGLVGYVERTRPEMGEAIERVVLQPEGGQAIDCQAFTLMADQQHQWGLAINPRGVFFFERRLGSAQTRLIISRDRACGDRVEVPLSGRPDEQARIYAGDQHLAWLERDAEGFARIMTLDLRALSEGEAALRPLGLTSPVELHARGRWLAAVRFQPEGYHLQLIDLEAPEAVHPLPPSSGSRRHPRLSDHHLIWAEQGPLSWEVHYARLPD